MDHQAHQDSRYESTWTTDAFVCLNALHQLFLLMMSANITDSDEILRRVSLATSENLDLMDPKAQRCVIYKENLINQVLLIFAD